MDMGLGMCPRAVHAGEFPVARLAQAREVVKKREELPIGREIPRALVFPCAIGKDVVLSKIPSHFVLRIGVRLKYPRLHAAFRLKDERNIAQSHPIVKLHRRAMAVPALDMPENFVPAVKRIDKVDSTVLAVVVRKPHLLLAARAEPLECLGEAVALWTPILPCQGEAAKATP